MEVIELSDKCDSCGYPKHPNADGSWGGTRVQEDCWAALVERYDKLFELAENVSMYESAVMDPDMGPGIVYDARAKMFQELNKVRQSNS